MKKAVALTAVGVLSLVGLTACGTSNNCPQGVGADSVALSVYAPAKGSGGGGHGGGSGGHASGGSTGGHASGESGTSGGHAATGEGASGGTTAKAPSSSTSGVRPGWYPGWMPWYGGGSNNSGNQCKK